MFQDYALSSYALTCALRGQFVRCRSEGLNISEALLMFTSRCLLRVQVSQGLGPYVRIELLKTGRTLADQGGAERAIFHLFRAALPEEVGDVRRRLAGRYVYIYIYIYTSYTVYVYVYVCVYVHMCIYICIYIHLSLSIYIYTRSNIMYTCIYIYIYI